MQMYAIARFSKWLRDQKLDFRQPDENTITRFLQRDPDVVHGGESAPLHRLLEMLRHSRVVVAQEPKPKNSRQRFTDIRLLLCDAVGGCGGSQSNESSLKRWFARAIHHNASADQSEQN